MHFNAVADSFQKFSHLQPSYRSCVLAPTSSLFKRKSLLSRTREVTEEKKGEDVVKNVRFGSSKAIRATLIHDIIFLSKYNVTHHVPLELINCGRYRAISTSNPPPPISVVDKKNLLLRLIGTLARRYLDLVF